MPNFVTYDSLEDAILSTVDQAIWTKQQYINANMVRRHSQFLETLVRNSLLEWHTKYQWTHQEIRQAVAKLFAQRIRQLPDEVLVGACLRRSTTFDDEAQVFFHFCQQLGM